MTDDGLVQGELHRRRRRVRKHGDRKRRNLKQNLRWVAGGFVIGLPLVMLMIYVASALASQF